MPYYRFSNNQWVNKANRQKNVKYPTLDKRQHCQNEYLLTYLKKKLLFKEIIIQLNVKLIARKTRPINVIAKSLTPS